MRKRQAEKGAPSARRAPVEQVERVLHLYRETYHRWNVRPFHQTVRREHGVVLSYTFLKKLPQEAGLVPREKKLLKRLGVERIPS